MLLLQVNKFSFYIFHSSSKPHCFATWSCIHLCNLGLFLSDQALQKCTINCTCFQVIIQKLWTQLQDKKEWNIANRKYMHDSDKRSNMPSIILRNKILGERDVIHYTARSIFLLTPLLPAKRKLFRLLCFYLLMHRLVGLRNSQFAGETQIKGH